MLQPCPLPEVAATGDHNNNTWIKRSIAKLSINPALAHGRPLFAAYRKAEIRNNTSLSKEEVDPQT